MAPALFALANNSAAALHANFQVVSTSSAAAPGEYALLYATGIGHTVGPIVSGPSGRAWLDAGGLIVTVDGLPAKVAWAGPAPGYEGLDQVNIQIPASVHRGTSVPVTMTVAEPTTNISNTVLLPIN